MGCTDSKPAVIAQPELVPPTAPSVPMSEDDLKKMLMNQQMELSARAKPLLESLKEDFDEQPDEWEMGSSSKMSNFNSPEGKKPMTNDQQLYKIAKNESSNAWMVMNDLPLSEDDIAFLKAFKTVVMDHIPKLTDGGNTYEAGQELLNKDDTPATSCAASVCGEESIASTALEMEPDEEDAIILAPRRNSKLIDVRETVIAKFGALENIPNPADAGAEEVSLHSSPVRDRLRRDSNAPEMINIKRQNSVEKFLKMDTLKVINENAILQNSALDRIKIDKNVSSPNSKKLGKGSTYSTPTKRKKKAIPDLQIPKGPMTIKSAISIYETYKQGGACTKETVHKVLRTAYRTMKNQPNVMHITLEADERLNVVGDLHGQLLDLVHILEESGVPSDKNRYVFNGDFVDRGPNGVEVTIILLAFYCVLPGSVYLNRGNHEDYAICCVYGFQGECIGKYDEITFGMFVEVFQYLPLFTVLNKSVMVVHGGLFHSKAVHLEELDSINRSDFTLKDLPQNGESLDEIDKETNSNEYLKQIQRDALWSDPCSANGLQLSTRGAGVQFGPDVTIDFLSANALNMVVRSHECVDNGFDYPYSKGSSSNGGDGTGSAEPNEDDVTNPGILCTVFSASNYGGKNDGAYMVFTSGDTQSNTTFTDASTDNAFGHALKPLPEPCYSAVVPDNNSLHYSFYRYSITWAKSEAMKKLFATKSWSIYDVVEKKSVELLHCFQQFDTGNDAQGELPKLNKEGSVHDIKAIVGSKHCTGKISYADWALVMEHVTKIKLKWMTMIPIVVAVEDRRDDKNLISYKDFINGYLTNGKKGNMIDESSATNPNISLIESLYINHQQLSIVFDFFDEKCEGRVTRPDLQVGIDRINKELLGKDSEARNCLPPLPPNSPKRTCSELLPTLSKYISNEHVDQLVTLLDVDEDNVVGVNEFFEVYRIADLKLQQLKK